MNDKHSVAAHFSGDFNEAMLQAWAENLRRELPAANVSLGLGFMSPKIFPHAKQVLEIIRVHAQVPLLAGCSSQGLIVGQEEIENAGGVTLGLYALPGAELKLFYFAQKQVEESGRP